MSRRRTPDFDDAADLGQDLQDQLERDEEDRLADDYDRWLDRCHHDD